MFQYSEIFFSYFSDENDASNEIEVFLYPNISIVSRDRYLYILL